MYLHFITEFVFYIQSNSGSLPAIFCLWNVSCKCPAIISQHTGPWYRFAMVEMSWLNRCPCSSRTVSRHTVKSKRESKKCNYKDITPHRVVGLYMMNHHNTIFFYLMISPLKLVVTFLNYFCAALSTSRSWFSKYTYSVNI